MYNDHHDYTLHDLQYLYNCGATFGDLLKAWVTTEKDIVKIAGLKLTGVLAAMPIFFIPAETRFIKNEMEFNNLITNN